MAVRAPYSNVQGQSVGVGRPLRGLGPISSVDSLMGTLPHAFVLGLGVTGLAVARSLGHAGTPVIGIWQRDDEKVGRLSRHCRTVRLPLDADLLAALLRLAPPGEKPVLIATSDAYAQWIGEHQDELRARFHFHTVEVSLLTRMNSKDGLIGLLSGLGVDFPATIHVRTLQQFERAAPGLRFPLLVKPADTFRRPLPGGAKNRVFQDLASLAAFVRGAPRNLPDMVMQEVIPSGDGRIWLCALLLSAEGRTVATFTCRKVRQYLPDFGSTCFGSSERNEEVAAIASSVMERLGYQDTCMLEFAHDQRAGKYALLEINVRASLATQLYVDCGCDLPLAEYRLLSGGPLPPVGPQREGRQWINLACDLGSWYRKRHTLSLRAWLRSALSARSFAALSLEDPLPWVTATADMVAAAPRLAWRSLLRALFRQGAPLSASAGEEPLVEQAMAIDHGLPRERPGPRAGER